ncbi:HNH endonuclease signature motif containing protein [soil metagenome]
MTHLLAHTDPRNPRVRVENNIAQAETAARRASMAYAEQIAAIHATLVEARSFPEVYVPFLRDASAVEFAERGAVADLAMCLGVAEQTIRAQDHEAETLLRRTPRVWEAFLLGDIAAPNARVISQLVSDLPEAAWAVFEDAVLVRAATLAPARFRTFARGARDRIDPRELPERHARRAEERRVWIDADVDGMCWLTAYLPAPDAHRAMAHLDASAMSLAAHPEENRTLAQLRADLATELLAGVLGASPSVGVSVAVTVPVMTLLGLTDEPAHLDGFGPIDADTAREISRHAPSFSRILTHPISGTVLDVDRTTYRVPADLKRWLGVRDGSCTFPGCGRRVQACDLDHTVDWQYGGTTSAANLAHLCRHHHRLKHNTRWRVEHTETGIRWTSPTGTTRTADPPPF